MSDGEQVVPDTDGGRDLIEVCPVDDLAEGERTVIEARGRSIGVFNLEGEYYALSNVCLHEGGPVCEGKVQHVIEAEFPGGEEPVREYYTDDWAVACPWHGWEYDVATGDHLGDAERSLPTYDVVVEDGTVYVEV